MNTTRVKNIFRYMRAFGYVVYKEAYKLNIIGIRSANTEANRFDDEILVAWYDEKGNLDFRVYKASTDPGTYWLNNPIEELGTAILKGGQYLDAYTLIDTNRFGFLTKEFYQQGNVTIIRDYDRNALLDFYNGRETTGTYGINIHTGTNPSTGESAEVGQWSAGCQVFAKWNEWVEMLQWAQKHIQHNGNVFTYTLLDSRATTRAQRRFGTYALIGGLLGLTAYSTYKILH